jgi:hypothetical protein
VFYNGVQVLNAGPQMEWQLGLIQVTKPMVTSRGYSGTYAAPNLTGTTPSILIDPVMGGYYDNLGISNASPTTVTSLAGGEPGMSITMVAADSNTTLTFGNSGGAFRTLSNSNLTLSAGKAYKFFNDGSNGTGGSCWVQL